MLRTILLYSLLLASLGLAEEALQYRELRCRVVDENGRAVPGVAVKLGGLDRDALGADWDRGQPKQPGVWNFITDSAGFFTARFGQFRTPEHLDDDRYDGPAWGRFYFVVSKPHWAGGVSRIILNLRTTPTGTNRLLPSRKICSQTPLNGSAVSSRRSC